MEPKQMLEAVIEKAIKNGYPDTITSRNPIVISEQLKVIVPVLFTHDFAKAYYGSEKTCDLCGLKAVFSENGRDCWCKCCDYPLFEPAWEYHLKEAVLSEDPLLYYYQHL